MSTHREFGVVVYGATGYTGRLVCEYLNKQYGVNGDVKWAMAGRSQEKLIQVRDEMGIPDDVPFVIADAGNPESVNAMVESTQVVLTTVGPYQKYGSDLVRVCSETGTDYVDLCGEPAWMHEMIAAHGETAKASGARIVFSCGFDSVPFDLGVHFLQNAAVEKLEVTTANTIVFATLLMFISCLRCWVRFTYRVVACGNSMVHDWRCLSHSDRQTCNSPL